MKTLKFYIAVLFLTIVACESNNQNNQANSTFNARVLGKGMDCGNTYLIQFNSDVQGLPPNDFDNVFYAINLPQNLQIDNLQINVNFRIPNNNEKIACTTMGISYPQIIIEN